MSKYTDLKEKFRELNRKRNVETPQDLTDVLDEIERLFSLYYYSDDKEKQEALLTDIEYMIQRYYDIENIVFHVGATVTPYNANDLLISDEESPIPITQYGISGEYILEKIHRESGLRRKENTIHKLFVELIGRWLDEWDTVEQIRKYSFRFADGVWLDELARNYGVIRLENETDDELRARLLLKKGELFTTPTLKSHDVIFFTCVKDPKTQLTSKNTYLTNDYLCYANDITEEYYDKTYVCWRDIRWL